MDPESLRLLVSDDIAVALDVLQVVVLGDLVLLGPPIGASASVAIVIGQLLPVSCGKVTKLSKVCIRAPR